MVGQSLAWSEEEKTGKFDLLTQEVNRHKSELARLADQVARLTYQVAPHEIGASASQQPKPTSTQQGLSDFVPHDFESLEQESLSSAGKTSRDAEANLENSSDEDNSSSAVAIPMLNPDPWWDFPSTSPSSKRARRRPFRHRFLIIRRKRKMD